MVTSRRAVALAAVVGLSLAHSTISFQAHHPVGAGGAQRSMHSMQSLKAEGARGRICVPVLLRVVKFCPSLVPSEELPLGVRRTPSTRPQKLMMAAAGSGSAVQVDAEEGPVVTAAQIAEEEAREYVSEVVEVMMSQSPATMAPAPIGSLPPRLWLDNVDALLNEPVYKNVMYQRLEACSSEQELVLLEVVDEKLLQFKKEQRDNRNKAKLEYVIGAALEGPQALDEVLLDLCETRGLDDGLVDYLDEIVEKARSAETQKPGEKKNEENKESMLVKMLTVIKDRVVAEIRTRDKPHVRMLAALLRMDDPPEREAFLGGAVQNPESAARFEEFVLDGIQYMERHRADWLVDERVEKMKDIAREVALFRDILEHRRSSRT